MTGMKQLAGIGIPDHKLCDYWVALRDTIQRKAKRVRNGTMRADKYSDWMLTASARYQAHAATCPHPQHTNPSYGYDAARRGRTTASKTGDFTRTLR